MAYLRSVWWRKLEGGFDGFGTAVGKEDLLVGRAGSDGCELFHQLDHGRVVEIAATDVDEIRGLGLDGGDDLGMAVAGGADGDAGGEVEEAIAIDVFDDAAEGALDDEGVLAGVRGGTEAFIAIDELAGAGAGEGRVDRGSGTEEVFLVNAEFPARGPGFEHA